MTGDALKRECQYRMLILMSIIILMLHCHYCLFKVL